MYMKVIWKGICSYRLNFYVYDFIYKERMVMASGIFGMYIKSNVYESYVYNSMHMKVIWKVSAQVHLFSMYMTSYTKNL